MPGLIWRRINRTCGIDAKVITNILSNMDSFNSENRKDALKSLVKHIDRAFTYHRDYHHGFM